MERPTNCIKALKEGSQHVYNRQLRNLSTRLRAGRERTKQESYVVVENIIIKFVELRLIVAKLQLVKQLGGQ